VRENMDKVKIAIIDSGVNNRHPAFAGSPPVSICFNVCKWG